MRIFLSFLQSPVQHPIPAYSFWQNYIKNGIEEAGHEWIECPDVDWALGLVPKSPEKQAEWKEKVWNRTIDWLKSNSVDVFLSYLYPEQIDMDTIAEIKHMGIPCVNFYCDNVRQYKIIPTEFQVFDLNWVPEFNAADMYEKAGYPYINLPMPMWVPPAKRTNFSESIEQITFIGSRDLQRLMLFEDIMIKQPDMPLKIYGAGWIDNPNSNTYAISATFSQKLLHQIRFLKANGLASYFRKLQQRGQNPDVSAELNKHLSGTATFEQYEMLTAQSMITLGVSRYPSFRFPVNKPDKYSRLRDIEAPMLGACYLTEWTKGIDRLYEIGKEIETYRTTDELIEKVAMLSADKKLRRKLKMNGQHRALSDHSVPVTITKIIKRLNGVIE